MSWWRPRGKHGSRPTPAPDPVRPTPTPQPPKGGSGQSPPIGGGGVGHGDLCPRCHLADGWAGK